MQCIQTKNRERERERERDWYPKKKGREKEIRINPTNQIDECVD